MRLLSALGCVLMEMSVLGQSAPPLVQVQSERAKEWQRFEQQFKAVQVADTLTANRMLELASKNDLKALRHICDSTKRTNEKLFAGYLLYRMDPHRFRAAFTRSFPIRDADVDEFLWCASSLPYLKTQETNGVIHSGVKWTISYWDIESAMLECVKAGDPDAVVRFACLKGRGDGAQGEGLDDDFMELYVEHPELVLQFWSVFRNGLGYLQNIDDWYDQEVKEKTRAKYCALLSASDPRLAAILKEIDTPSK